MLNTEGLVSEFLVYKYIYKTFLVVIFMAPPPRLFDDWTEAHHLNKILKE